MERVNESKINLNNWILFRTCEDRLGNFSTFMQTCDSFLFAVPQRVATAI